MPYFGHKSRWAGGTKHASGPFNMSPPRGGPVSRPFRGTPSGGGLSRLVPSGSPGGPARVPNSGSMFGTPRSGTPLMGGFKAAQATTKMRGWQMMLKGFGRLAGPVGVALNAYDAWEWWKTQTTQSSPYAEVVLPAPWVLECPGWLPKQRWWGHNNSCGTGPTSGQITIPASAENTVIAVGAGASAKWRVYLTEANNTILGPNFYRRNATAGMPRSGPFTGPTPYKVRTTTNGTGLYTPPPAVEQEVSLGGRNSTVNTGLDDWWSGQNVPGYFTPAITITITVNPTDSPTESPTGEPVGTPSTGPGVDTGTTTPPHVPTGVSVTGPGPGWHLNVPDESVKWRLGGPWLRNLGRLYGAFTEWDDAMDCLNKAMPGNPCPKSMSMHERTACILSRLGQADPGKAETCMAQENAKDFAIGKWSRMGSDAFGKRGREGWHGRPVGPGFGGWGARMHQM